MKKALIALSVAAGMVGVAQAENTTTLFGSIGYDMQLVKAVELKNVKNKTDSDLHQAKAVFGIEGTEDLNNGLQAFYKYEFEVNSGDKAVNVSSDYPEIQKVIDAVAEAKVINVTTSQDFKTKKAYIGLKGAFGKITFGNQSSVYEDATDTANPFQTADGWYQYKGTEAHTNKAISYVGEFSGFNVGALVDLDGSDNASRSIDSYELAAWYEMNGFNAGLAYSHHKMKAGAKESVALALGYAADQYQVDFSASHEASADSGYNLSGEYYYGPHTFRAGLGYLDAKEKDMDVWGLGLGYQYNFSKRTYTWVEGSYSDPEDKDMDSGYTLSVGIRHDF